MKFIQRLMLVIILRRKKIKNEKLKNANLNIN